MRYLVLSGLAILAGACEKIPGTDEYRIKQAQGQLAEMLREPKSAQFRDVFVARGNLDGKSQTLVCGLVNGRNALGGYTEFMRFYYSEVAEAAFIEPPSDYGNLDVRDAADSCSSMRGDAFTSPAIVRMTCDRAAEIEQDYRDELAFNRFWNRICEGAQTGEP